MEKCQAGSHRDWKPGSSPLHLMGIRESLIILEKDIHKHGKICRESRKWGANGEETVQESWECAGAGRRAVKARSARFQGSFQRLEGGQWEGTIED